PARGAAPHPSPAPPAGWPAPAPRATPRRSPGNRGGGRTRTAGAPRPARSPRRGRTAPSTGRAASGPAARPAIPAGSRSTPATATASRPRPPGAHAGLAPRPVRAAAVAHHQAPARTRDDLAGRHPPVLQRHGPILGHRHDTPGGRPARTVPPVLTRPAGPPCGARGGR